MVKLSPTGKLEEQIKARQETPVLTPVEAREERKRIKKEEQARQRAERVKEFLANTGVGSAQQDRGVFAKYYAGRPPQPASSGGNYEAYYNQWLQREEKARLRYIKARAIIEASEKGKTLTKQEFISRYKSVAKGYIEKKRLEQAYSESRSNAEFASRRPELFRQDSQSFGRREAEVEANLRVARSKHDKKFVGPPRDVKRGTELFEQFQAEQRITPAERLEDFDKVPTTPAEYKQALRTQRKEREAKARAERMKGLRRGDPRFSEVMEQERIKPPERGGKQYVSFGSLEAPPVKYIQEVETDKGKVKLIVSEEASKKIEKAQLEDFWSGWDVSAILPPFSDSKTYKDSYYPQKDHYDLSLKDSRYQFSEKVVSHEDIKGDSDLKSFGKEVEEYYSDFEERTKSSFKGTWEFTKDLFKPDEADLALLGLAIVEPTPIGEIGFVAKKSVQIGGKVIKKLAYPTIAYSFSKFVAPKVGEKVEVYTGSELLGESSALVTSAVTLGTSPLAMSVAGVEFVGSTIIDPQPLITEFKESPVKTTAEFYLFPKFAKAGRRAKAEVKTQVSKYWGTETPTEVLDVPKTTKDLLGEKDVRTIKTKKYDDILLREGKASASEKQPTIKQLEQAEKTISKQQRTVFAHFSPQPVPLKPMKSGKLGFEVIEMDKPLRGWFESFEREQQIHKDVPKSQAYTFYAEFMRDVREVPWYKYNPFKMKKETQPEVTLRRGQFPDTPKWITETAKSIDEGKGVPSEYQSIIKEYSKLFEETPYERKFSTMERLKGLLDFKLLPKSIELEGKQKTRFVSKANLKGARDSVRLEFYKAMTAYEQQAGRGGAVGAKEVLSGIQPYGPEKQVEVYTGTKFFAKDPRDLRKGLKKGKWWERAVSDVLGVERGQPFFRIDKESGQLGTIRYIRADLGKRRKQIKTTSTSEIMKDVNKDVKSNLKKQPKITDEIIDLTAKFERSRKPREVVRIREPRPRISTTRPRDARDISRNLMRDINRELDRTRRTPERRRDRPRTPPDITRIRQRDRMRDRMRDRERKRERERTRQLNRQLQRFIQRPPTIRVPPPPTLIPPELTRAKKKPTRQGYDVLVKDIKRLRSGRIKEVGYKKVNVQPLTRDDALARGAYVADVTASRTFKIQETNKPFKDIRNDPYWLMNQGKFRKKIRKGKEQDTGTWIEKTGHAIDSAGEIEQITVKGLLAQERKRKVAKRLTTKTPKIKTPNINMNQILKGVRI